MFRAYYKVDPDSEERPAMLRETKAQAVQDADDLLGWCYSARVVEEPAKAKKKEGGDERHGG